ncbi:MAG TPA: amidohydrolase, partial [Thermoanaerobaculia bacterium]|nr:amidohydrolase [Thermoanaerobaculia bacterium]
MRRLFPLVLFAAASALSAETIAIVGGTIHPVSAPEIREGTVLIVDGKITAVGPTVQIPAGTKTYDARGKHVYPS